MLNLNIYNTIGPIVSSCVINTTPHDIVVAINNDIVTFPKSNLIIRLDFETEIIGDLNGIPIIKNILVGHNLPEEKEDTIYIVSGLVLSAFPDRTDLFAPDSNRANRNEKGHIISVPGFVK